LTPRASTVVEVVIVAFCSAKDLGELARGRDVGDGSRAG
jgi:hypothetical protein